MRFVFYLRSVKYVLAVIYLLIFSDMNGIPDAILKLQTGKCLFVGKIVEVTRVILFFSSCSALSVS